MPIVKFAYQLSVCLLPHNAVDILRLRPCVFRFKLLKIERRSLLGFGVEGVGDALCILKLAIVRHGKRKPRNVVVGIAYNGATEGVVGFNPFVVLGIPVVLVLSNCKIGQYRVVGLHTLGRWHKCGAFVLRHTLYLSGYLACIGPCILGACYAVLALVIHTHLAPLVVVAEFVFTNINPFAFHIHSLSLGLRLICGCRLLSCVTAHTYGGCTKHTIGLCCLACLHGKWCCRVYTCVA